MPDRTPATTHVRAWLTAPLWRLIGYALLSLLLGVIGALVAALGPASAVRTLAHLERRRAARVLAIIDGNAGPRVDPTSDGAPGDRVRLLAGAPFGAFIALVAALSVFLIFRALCEIAFIWLWPEAFVGAWGGSMAGVLAVHCTPGVITLLGGPWAVTRSCGWVARRWAR